MKQMRVKAGFVVPAFFVYTVLLVIPIIMAFGLSFVSWNGIGEMKFVGLQNFRMVFRDKSIGNAVFNTLVITLVQTVVCNVLGFGCTPESDRKTNRDLSNDLFPSQCIKRRCNCLCLESDFFL